MIPSLERGKIYSAAFYGYLAGYARARKDAGLTK
jgi:hypothetical protein